MKERTYRDGEMGGEKIEARDNNNKRKERK